MSINQDLYPPIPPVAPSVHRPFWTVVVPAYKAQCLAQALRSVLDQDPGPERMQIIVLDDCSPQPIEQTVRQLGTDRIAYHRNRRNVGTYATQNEALKLSQGTWIHVLNDDDWVLPGFYDTFENALKNQPESVGAACCMFATADANGSPTWTPDMLRTTPGIIPNWIQTLGVRGVLQPVSVVVRRSTHEHLGGFCPGMKYTADWEFYKRSAIFYDWWYEPRVLAYYREHDQNCTTEAVLSGDQIRELGRAIEMTEPLLPPAVRAQITAASREYNAIYALKRAERLFEGGRLDAAVQQLQAGMKLSSTQVVLDHLLLLLAQPAALPLKQLLPQFLQMVKFQA